MAVAFDAASTATGSTNDTTLSVSHTAGGVNRIVFVAAGANDGGPAIQHSGLTYGGDDVTIISTLGSTNKQMIVGYLINPDAAAQTAEVTWSSSPNFGHWIIAVSYVGVSQTGTPFSTINVKSTDGASSLVITVSTGTGAGVSISVLNCGADTITTGTGSTMVLRGGNAGGGFSFGQWGDDLLTTAASTAMRYAFDAEDAGIFGFRINSTLVVGGFVQAIILG